MPAASGTEGESPAMRNWFGSDSPFIRFLGAAADLMLLNVLALLKSIPVVTAGASLSAMFYCMIRMLRGDDTYTVRSYFHSFRENLGQGVILTLIFGGIGVFLAFDLKAAEQLTGSAGAFFVKAVPIVMVVAEAVGICSFLLLARFRNTIRRTVGNAVILMMAAIPRTVVILILLGLIGYAYRWFNVQILPVLLLFGVSLPAFLVVKLLDPMLVKMEERARETENSRTEEGEE